jgi:hypothetical protein
VKSKDPLYFQAVALVLGSHKASISMVQRKLQILYSRAATLIEEMEKTGVVSPADAVSGIRQVLLSRSPIRAPLEWTPLPEDPLERQQFDQDFGGQRGDIRLKMAQILKTWGTSNPGGSFAATCNIMANEIAKLNIGAAFVTSDVVGQCPD